MHSREISDLHPMLQPLARAMLARAQALGIHPLIACTYRDNAEQDMDYAYGRTTRSPVGPWSATRPLGAIVTRARGGQSAHNNLALSGPQALAFDVYPTIGGKLVLKTSSPLWAQLGACGTAVGLEWYGTAGAKFKEYPHFCLPMWRDIMFHMEPSEAA